MNDDIYQQAILDLAASARAAARLPSPDVTVTVDNPLCGDRITLDLSFDGDRIAAVGHKTRGCVLCQASATLLAIHAMGRSAATLLEQKAALAAALRAPETDMDAVWPDLEVFSPVRPHRSRHDCVLLPFAALEEALAARP